jgi:uncharacterized protein YecE (DUF72 family)
VSPCIYIGCAGWSIPRENAPAFPDAGSHLARYSQVFNAVEINSSFYRSHRFSTYQRWAATVPRDFRFSVKLSKQITHVRRLAAAGELLEQFAAETSGLGDKLGAVLVQLPPSLQFDADVADAFFATLRRYLHCAVACEPRHPSWFAPPATWLLDEHRIARAAADPSVVPAAASPAGDPSIAYFRWHGSPRMYYSAYDAGALASLARQINDAAARSDVWCIFDNTAARAAIPNALSIAAEIVPQTAPCR